MMTKETIFKLRQELCMEQKELAVLIGVSKQSLWAYEKGVRNPSRPVVRKLMELVKKHKLKFKLEDFMNE